MDTEYQWRQDESGNWYYLASDGNCWHNGETEDHPTDRQQSASTSQARAEQTRSYLDDQRREKDRRRMSEGSRTKDIGETLDRYSEVLSPKKGTSSRKGSRKNADDSKTKGRK
ncbi:hypothetical protein CMUS01_10878 [Colletotrichum musicola]|uniref:Uncharacterized protein n=1 Tax=Colletotrichum musicola TaxID=2175873 RepID=A0A8H6N789_9PEZI|nr:hypothetical protein CMUS01_10878 [Colletotrichum musicola]